MTDESVRHPASEALIALRKALDGKVPTRGSQRAKMTQQRFAVELLETSIGTIARYETTDPPRGDVLLKLSNIAREYKEDGLADRFRSLYLEDIFKTLDDRLTVVPTSDDGKEPAKGFLMLRLTGRDALSAAQAFMNVISMLKSPEPRIKKRAMAAVDELEKAADIHPAAETMMDVFSGTRRERRRK